MNDHEICSAAMGSQLEVVEQLADRLRHICEVMNRNLAMGKVYLWPSIYSMNASIDSLSSAIETIDCDIAPYYIERKQ